jgi:site-specific DNA-methyltransferase (adenine-specific)
MQVTDKIKITNEDNMLLMARYPDNYFDLAIVDPPYGIGESNKNFESRGVSSEKWKRAKPKKYEKKDWDNFAPNKNYFIELQRVSKNQIIWGANHFIENIPNANSSCWVVWDKDNSGDFADCEIALTTFKSAIRKIKLLWSGFRKCENVERSHPTQKPILLYKWLIDKYAKENDKILDTHLGSGSIAIACHDYGFELTACELDKEYYDKAMQRIVNHTNQTKLF